MNSPNFDADAVSFTTKRDGESKLYSADIRATGDLYEMQHGALAVAVGAEPEPVMMVGSRNSSVTPAA